jgi:uncharacterized membrane protein YdjX (TVP38/TMEM64 family)
MLKSWALAYIIGIIVGTIIMLFGLYARTAYSSSLAWICVATGIMAMVICAAALYTNFNSVYRGVLLYK